MTDRFRRRVPAVLIMTEPQKTMLAEIRDRNSRFGWGFVPEDGRQDQICKRLVAMGKCEHKTGSRAVFGYWVTE